jgi:hypothetical protein
LVERFNTSYQRELKNPDLSIKIITPTAPIIIRMNRNFQKKADSVAAAPQFGQ